jgi:hypothetical protein
VESVMAVMDILHIDIYMFSIYCVPSGLSHVYLSICISRSVSHIVYLSV